MSCLVDTDWIIDGLRGRPEALAALEERRDEGLGVSIITLGEVYEGAVRHEVASKSDERRYFIQACVESLFPSSPCVIGNDGV